MFTYRFVFDAVIAPFVITYILMQIKNLVGNLHRRLGKMWC
jgi:hypothetical protein